MINLVGVGEVGVVSVRWFGELMGHLIWQEMWQDIRVGVLWEVGRKRLVGLRGTCSVEGL